MTLEARKFQNSNVRKTSGHCFLNSLSARSTFAFITLMILLALPQMLLAQANQNFILQTATGGASITGTTPTYTTTFGNLDALGVGTPATGVTGIAVSNGILYYSPINFVMGNLLGHHQGIIKAYVSSNFTHPTAMILNGCPNNATCTTSASYTTLSTSAASPTTIVPIMNENSTTTAYIAILVPDNNGAGAFAGTDSATVTFTGTDANNGNALNTVTLRFNSQSLVTAIRLTLATATGGLTINPSSDYSMSYGNVNGLGVGAATGLTIVSAAGGVIYSTPYNLTPVFSNFTSTTGTIKVALSTPFAHSAVLGMRSATALAGPYTTLTSTATQITNTATSRTVVTPYLGLFVSNVNGAGAFSGSDSATLTFTLTVP